VVPHRVDNRTIKVPIPKYQLPFIFSRIQNWVDFCFFRTTLEAKKQVYASAKRKSEEIRVQIRSKHSASLKRGKYDKHSIEVEEVYPSLSGISLMFDV
jgi:ribosome recycling factor